MITNTPDRNKFDANEFRKLLRRFSGEHWINNKELAEAFSELASGKNCTPSQMALAWLLAQGDHIIPIPGTKHRKYLEENAGAVDINLTSSDLNDIETLFNRLPDTGYRYSENFVRQVDKQ